MSRSSSRYKRVLSLGTHWAGFSSAIPLWGQSGLLSLHLAWYHGTVVKVTNIPSRRRSARNQTGWQKDRDRTSTAIRNEGTNYSWILGHLRHLVGRRPVVVCR